MSSPVISVENLGKKYRLRHHQPGRGYVALRDVLADRAKSLARGPWSVVRRLWAEGSEEGRGESEEGRGEREEGREKRDALRSPPSPLPAPAREDFWALKNVSFEVHQGDVLGIIGRNGAGKSTLLKILSRITEPTEGRVRIRGRVASLLEVGTGFHPELTGRENIFLNGAILGMARAEIRKKFDEIVAFAEVEKFLDTPVKHYSSGMYVRLAFAVAAHLEPEILIVDEVLAVGDLDFQKKCLGKMQSASAEEGRTVLFVSHNMGTITQLCTRALLLADGGVKASGTPREIVRLYANSFAAPPTNGINQLFRGPLAGRLSVRSVCVGSNGSPSSLVSPGAEIRIEVVADCAEAIPAFRTTMALFSSGVRLLSMHDVPDAEPLEPGSAFKSVFVLPPHFLRPADYFVAVGGHSATSGEWLWATDVAQFTVLEEWKENFRPYDTGLINVADRGQRIRLN